MFNCIMLIKINYITYITYIYILLLTIMILKYWFRNHLFPSISLNNKLLLIIKYKFIVPYNGKSYLVVIFKI